MRSLLLWSFLGCCSLQQFHRNIFYSSLLGFVVMLYCEPKSSLFSIVDIPLDTQLHGLLDIHCTALLIRRVSNNVVMQLTAIKPYDMDPIL